MIIAGIKRSNLFSPNHVGNDSSIFGQTVQCLSEAGYHVNEYSEEEFPENGVGERLIFTMARSKKIVALLQEMERNGAIVINSGFGIENCYRANMTKLLLAAGIPYPESIIIDTLQPGNALEKLGGKNIWIKRGDFHAIHKEDVTFVRHAEEGREMLGEYALRGIDSVVLCKHIPGDLVKFYGVGTTGFFYWFYPSEAMHSKFGTESVNGEIKHLPFEASRLKETGFAAARVLGVDIYGGDAIIRPDGSICLIDLNDWPSFAPCRNEAASNIAQSIIKAFG